MRSSLTPALLAALLVACGAPQAPEPSPVQAVAAEPLAGGEVLTTSGGVEALRAILVESAADDITSAFLHAELDLLDGHFTRAFDRFLEVAAIDPNHVLAAVAMQRVSNLDGNVPSMASRLQRLRERVAGYRLVPLSAITYSRLELQLLHDEHNHAGLDDIGPFSAESIGMPDEWRVIGPMSFRRFFHFQRDEAPDGDEVLSDRYDLSGRDVRTRTLRPDGQSVRLPTEHPGTYLFETWIELDAGSQRLVVLESSVDAAVTIDGEPIVARRNVGDYAPGTLARPVLLRAGWHRVRVRVGAPQGGAEFRLRFVPLTAGDGALTAVASPTAGTRFAGVAAEAPHAADFSRMVPPELLDPIGPVEAYALFTLAVDFEIESYAEVGMAWLLDRGELSPLTAMLAAKFSGRQRSRSPADRENLRLQWLREAAELAPEAGLPRFSLAAALQLEGRSEEATEVMQELAVRLGGEPSMAMGLYELYSSRGFDELAERWLERLLEAAPESCVAVAEWSRLLYYR